VTAQIRDQQSEIVPQQLGKRIEHRAACHQAMQQHKRRPAAGNAIVKAVRRAPLRQ